MPVIQPRIYIKYVDIQVSPLPNRRYILLKSVSFYRTESNTSPLITIPSGYMTNGANIPRIFWSIIEPNQSDILPAVILHDFLCDNAAKDRTDIDITFKEADTKFRDNLKALEEPRWKVNLLYYSVRVYHILRYELWQKKIS